MRAFYFAIMLTAGSFAAKAQDQLFKKDNSKLLVKVIEVGLYEVKYKMHNNLTGPSYTENKSNVTLIIYEGGQHEVMNVTSTQTTRAEKEESPVESYRMSSKDSLSYFKHTENISLNFLYFLNNEVGLMYQKEFFRSHFNIMIPVAIGIQRPVITQSVYFPTTTDAFFELDRKLFEAGLGVNYYPSLASNINYFVGPMFRYMQYEGTHYYSYLRKRGTLSRYCVSITNGIIFRTRSRLTFSLYGSLGFKSDVADNEIKHPITGKAVNTISSPLSLYFWSGFNLGFCF